MSGVDWLAPLGWVWARLMDARNASFDRSGGHKAGIPVVSVGNLTVGGTGKTPTVAWIVRRLLDDGLAPAVVSRGYRGRAGRGPVVVADGSGAGPEVGPEICGDEPFMLARTLPGARVVVGSDRVAGAAEAMARGADTVVLDDGFQHRRLARNLDVVLLDASTPLDGARVLPAGPLREPVRGLGRADVILVTRCAADSVPGRLLDTVRRHNTNAPVLAARHRVVGFVDDDGNEREQPARCLAFCAIGRPESFRSDLTDLGVEVVRFRAFRDHHAFSNADIAGLRADAEREDLVPVTTEKDLARLAGVLDRFGPRGPVALRIDVDLVGEEALLAAIRRAVGSPS